MKWTQILKPNWQNILPVAIIILLIVLSNPNIFLTYVPGSGGCLGNPPTCATLIYFDWLKVIEAIVAILIFYILFSLLKVIKKRTNYLPLLIGTLSLIGSYFLYYFVGVSYSECAICNYSGNWLYDIIPPGPHVCLDICSSSFRNLVPNGFFILFGWLGIILLLIGLIKSVYDYYKH